MKRFTSHLLVAFLTFAISIIGMTPVFYKPSKNAVAETIAPIEKQVETNKDSLIKEMPKQTEPESLSPYDIESFINNNPQADIENVWQKLGISGKFNALPDWEKNKSFFGGCNTCQAETFQYNLDDESGDEILLRIADRMQESCRYLLFKKINSEDDRWKLLGFIDHDFGRYQMPTHSFLLSGGKSFLVVKVQTQSGSGVSQYNDRLFLVRKDELVELIDYTSEGHQTMSFYQYFGARKFFGRAADVKIRNDSAQVVLDYTVEYEFEDGEKEQQRLFWSKKQTAVFDISLKSRGTILNAAKSNITEKELNSVYNVDSLDAGEFVEFNRAKLKKLSTEKEIKMKNLMRKFDYIP